MTHLLSTEPIPTFHLPLSPDLPRSGDLSVTPAYAVLAWASQHMFSGRIVFERENRVKRLELIGGNVLSVRSNLIPESFVTLAERNLQPASKIQTMLLELSVDGRGRINEKNLEERLLNEKIATQAQIQRLYRVQRDEILLNLSGWFEGAYQIEDRSVPETNDTSATHSLAQFLERLEALISGTSDGFMLGKEEELPETGDLRLRGGAAVIHFLSRKNADGPLLLEKSDRRKLLEFRSGRVESVSSSSPAETLSRVLRRWQYLPEEVILKAEAEAHAAGKKFREWLLEQKLLSPEEIASGMRTLHAERVLEAISWRSGRFVFRGKFLEKAAAPSTLPFETEATRLLTEMEKENGLAAAIVSPDGQDAARTLAEIFRDHWKTRGRDVSILSDEGEILGDSAAGMITLWVSNGCRNIPFDKLAVSRVVFLIQQHKTLRADIETNVSQLPQHLQTSASFVFQDRAFNWRTIPGWHPQS